MKPYRSKSTISHTEQKNRIWFHQKTNWLQIWIGLLALIIGSLVYLVDRPPGQTYFMHESRLNISLYDMLPNLFGATGNILPDFFHVFAFTLISAGILSAGKTGCIVMTAFWFLADTLFEFGQKFSHAAASQVPAWFESIPFLENTSTYFKNGTFDWLDIAAILTGTVCAYFVLINTMKGKKVP